MKRVCLRIVSNSIEAPMVINNMNFMCAHRCISPLAQKRCLGPATAFTTQGFPYLPVSRKALAYSPVCWLLSPDFSLSLGRVVQGPLPL